MDVNVQVNFILPGSIIFLNDFLINRRVVPGDSFVAVGRFVTLVVFESID